MTIRARLTLTYSILLAASGGAMLALVYTFMRYVPTYELGTVAPLDDTVGTISDTLTGAKRALTITSETDVLSTLLMVSVVALAAVVLVSAGAGWIISGKILHPLHAINDAARRAGTGSFDHRIGSSGPRDEISELSDTFDGMLEQLDHSFHTYKRFAANASHELRTPLATTKAMLDVALADPTLAVEDYRELAIKLSATNRRSIETIEALLDMAGFDHAVLSQDVVDLGVVVDDVIARIAPEATQRGLTIEHTASSASSSAFSSAMVRGNRTMLERLVSNLLENAIRHNVQNGTIAVSVGGSGSADVDGIVDVDELSRNGAVLTVSNTGEVVAQETIERLSEPFYRGMGRVWTDNSQSHGLGLGIVKSIASAHGGVVTLSPRVEGGLLVEVVFPLP